MVSRLTPKRTEWAKGRRVQKASHKEGSAYANAPSASESLKRLQVIQSSGAHQGVNGRVKREKNAWGFLMRKDTEREGDGGIGET